MGLATWRGTVIDHPPMMKRIWFAMVIAAIAACNKGDKSLEPGVFGKVVAPPGKLAGLKVGMSVDEAKKVAGDMVPDKTTHMHGAHSGYTGMMYRVSVDDDHTKIDRILVELPKTGKDVLVKAWGPGIDGMCMGDEPCTYWFDQGTQTRAVLKKGFRDKLDLDFRTFTPIDKLFGAKPGTLGFETGPVIGATVDDLRKAYPALHVDTEKDGHQMVYLDLEPTQYDDYFTRAYFDLDHDKVAGMSTSISYRPNPKAKDEIVAAIEKVWGKGIASTDLGQPAMVWIDPATGRRAKASFFTEGEIQVKFDSFMPIAKFLGDAPDKLGWETTPLLGANAADVAKAYPQYADTEGGTLTLHAPGIEWSDYTLVQFHADDTTGAIKQVVFELSFESNPAAKDAIKAALEKKYGAAKEGQDVLGRPVLVLRDANPRVTAEEDDIMKGWDIEIGSE